MQGIPCPYTGFSFLLLLSLVIPFLYWNITGFETDSISYSSDSWCKHQCASLSTCLERFGQNHVDLQLQLRFNQTILHLYGQTLENEIYLGETISQQSFEKIFVFDISLALGLSPCQIYVTNIERKYHHENANEKSYTLLLVSFRWISVDAEAIRVLTRKVQEYDSSIHQGRISRYVDASMGLVVPTWDLSLKLMYTIRTILGSDTTPYPENKVIWDGSLRRCNSTESLLSSYCEFEFLFRHDIAGALNISDDEVDVISVSASGLDSVIVSFRFIPISENLFFIYWMDNNIHMLNTQIADIDSELYRGNVTFRVDPTWGISGVMDTQRERSSSKLLTLPVRGSPIDSYERCKSTRSCARAVSKYSQDIGKMNSTLQYYERGEDYETILFLDFEDWQQGTHGWKQSCHWESSVNLCKPRPHKYDSKPKGAHWSPFNFDSLGPKVPTYGGRSNQGLVLNKDRKTKDRKLQADKINDIEAHIQWLGNIMFSTSLDTSARFRKDIIDRLIEKQKKYLEELKAAQDILMQLSSSQCVSESCSLLFNTSSLLLSGIIEAQGCIAVTPDGTEVAIWSFDSIDLGSEVTISMTGQRAMALLSRSSLYINTSIHVNPGTLGGFPGGYAVARADGYRYRSICREDINESQRENECYGKENCCVGDIAISAFNARGLSNNINGPGSPSVRVYLHTIQTFAPIVHEIRALRIDSIPGESIIGGFKLHYACYSTPYIAHNVSAESLMMILEDSLNAAKLSSLYSLDRSNEFCSGIGKVQVSKHTYGIAGGIEWKITFTSAVGAILPLSISSFLGEKAASISIASIVSANVIKGSFSLTFIGHRTRSLSCDISAHDMKTSIMSDFPFIISAEVVRTDSTGNCGDGYCLNGPTQSLGYTWLLSMTTGVGNYSPPSPTSGMFDFEGKIEELAAINELAGCIQGQCPKIIVKSGHNATSSLITRSTAVQKPFSLSYGGNGGGHGGMGGQGFTYPPAGDTFGDAYLSNLYGGSGGSSGLRDLSQLGMADIFSRARGGSGGGALELVANNDIVLGTSAALSCDGESGWDNFSTAGGGGSGGSILLAAGGSISISGKLSAKGGSGGSRRDITTHSSSLMRVSGGGGGGRIAIYGQSVTMTRVDSMHIDVSGGACQRMDSCVDYCKGENGTIHVEKGLDQGMRLDSSNGGAMGTSVALIIRGEIERISPRPNGLSSRPSHFQSGPEYIFQRLERPSRISFFIKLGSSNESSSTGWGAIIEFRSRTWAESVNDREAPVTSAIALFVGEKIMHTSNFVYMPSKTPSMESMISLYNKTSLGRWYKVDLSLKWKEMVYDISIDDSHFGSNSFPFRSPGIKAISVSNIHSNVDAWIDELYVGDDTLLGFDCSYLVTYPMQIAWSHDEYKWSNSAQEMIHHESHLLKRENLLKRETYIAPDHSGFSFFDGQGHSQFKNDVKFKDVSESWKDKPLDPALLLIVHERASQDKKYILYGGFNSTASSNNERGGVYACSSTDLINWKNEGLMLSYRNISDMVDGVKVPLMAKRPKVVFNQKTNSYVMWMILENQENDLGMTGIAISDTAGGPFEFVRSFYPDGNKTKDQTIFINKNGTAFLLRTFYMAVDYILPEAVMQPIWESVRDENGETNFGLSFHRAHYEPDYDNFHDIDGNLSTYGVKSRFLDPDSPANNIWQPHSVIGVKAQTWKANYRDGSCGIRKRSDDLELLDPDRVENRADCSNIADNPIHSTPPDRLIGIEKVIETRLAKYVAISQLTEDYLDTTGVLAIVEGGLDDGSRVVSSSAFLRMKEFDKIPMSLKSTYVSPIRSDSFHQEKNWASLFHQYEKVYNDRAYYSLACLLDKKCPVNFKNQITQE